MDSNLSHPAPFLQKWVSFTQQSEWGAVFEDLKKDVQHQEGIIIVFSDDGSAVLMKYSELVHLR